MKKILRLAALLCAVIIAATCFTACGTKKMAPAEAKSGTVRILSMQRGTLLRQNDAGGWYVYAENCLVTSNGSAFGVGDVGKKTEYFVTNRHVVELIDSEIYLGSERCWFTADTAETYIMKDDFAYSETTDDYDTSRLIPCQIIYQADANSPDIAVVKAAEMPEDRIALAINADSASVPEGAKVYALGYPGTSDQIVVDPSAGSKMLGSVNSVTVTDGAVSMHTTLNDGNANVRIIQHTAVINHGNSGGPLIDENGAVIGINTWGWGADIATGDVGANGSVEADYLIDLLKSQNVPFEIYSAGIPNIVIWILIGVAVVAVIVIVIVVIVVCTKKKTPVNVNGGGSGVNPPIGAPCDTGYRAQGLAGVHNGRRYAIMTGKPLTFGCNTGSVIKFPSGTPGVSGNHCTVWVDGMRIFIKDNGSTYGTFVGQTKLAPNQTLQLNPGDSFALGSQKERFVIAVKGGN